MLKCDTSREVSEFIDILTSHLLFPSISLRTRVTVRSQTLIDNILFTPNKYEVSSGNLTVGISDHMPQFLIFDTPSLSKNPLDSYYRDWKSFDRENFILDFFDIDWNDKLNLANKDPDASFLSFYNGVSVLVDRYAPMRKATKKQLKAKLKPWVTKGIRKSIQQRNKFYKLFIKCKNPDLKNNLHFQFKQHRNQIVHLLRVSKNNHYKNFFNDNIKNSKQTWKGIREIIQNNKVDKSNNISLNINDTLVSDPNIVTNSFNDFFTSIANKIRNKITPSRKNFKQYLKNSPNNSFFFSPINSLEIVKIINSLDPKKASGPFSIPNQIKDYFT